MVDEGFAERLKILAKRLDLKQHNIYKDWAPARLASAMYLTRRTTPATNFCKAFLVPIQMSMPIGCLWGKARCCSKTMKYGNPMKENGLPLICGSGLIGLRIF